MSLEGRLINKNDRIMKKIHLWAEFVNKLNIEAGFKTKYFLCDEQVYILVYVNSELTLNNSFVSAKKNLLGERVYWGYSG